MAAASYVKSSLTLLDGTTYHKEFPVWTSASSGKNLARGNTSTVIPPNKHVYYESLKPIFIVLTLAGILPVFKLEIGSHKMQQWLIRGVCFSIYLIFGYFTYLVTTDILYLILHDDDFSSIIVQVTLMMLLMQHAFYLVLTWPESLAVNKYLSHWSDFQTQYETVTGTKLVLTCRGKIMIAICVAAIMSAGFPYMINMIDNKSITTNTAYVVLFYHNFIQQCFYILWLSNSWAITQAAEHFNSRLIQECSMDILPERLEDHRLMWVKLTELVRTGSSMLSYTMALMVTTPFAYEVIAAYNLTMFVIISVQQGELGQTEGAVAIASTFLIHGTFIYMFCNSGHWITVKCQQVQDILLTHQPRMPLTMAKVNSELRLFMNCLRSLPPHATLSGYVIVNRKVFLHMVGVLVTYVIILVQFNISSVNQNGGNQNGGGVESTRLP